MMQKGYCLKVTVRVQLARAVIIIFDERENSDIPVVPPLNSDDMYRAVVATNVNGIYAFLYDNVCNHDHI